VAKSEALSVVKIMKHDFWIYPDKKFYRRQPQVRIK